MAVVEPTSVVSFSLNISYNKLSLPHLFSNHCLSKLNSSIMYFLASFDDAIHQ